MIRKYTGIIFFAGLLWLFFACWMPISLEAANIAPIVSVSIRGEIDAGQTALV